MLRFKKDDGTDYPNWEEKKLSMCLKEIIDNRGKTPPIVTKGYPLIEIASVGNFEVNYNKVSKFVNQDVYGTWFRKHLKKGDVLFSTVGNTALCSFYDGKIKACVAQNIIGLRFKDEYDSRFMLYMMSERNNKRKIKSIQMNGVQPSIKTSQLVELKFLLPCSAEQTKIADFLSGVDEIISTTEKELEDYELQKKDVMQKIFSQEVRFKADDGTDYPEAEEKVLGECCECLDFMRKPVKRSDRRQGPYPYYGSSNIQDYVDDYLFDEPLVLLAEDAGPFNEFLTKPIAQYVEEKCWVNNHTHVLRPKQVAKYVFYALEHKDIRMYINNPSRGKLNQDEMLKISILYPCIDEQKKIADFLSAFDEAIDETKHELDCWKQIKKGLLQQMFI